MYIARQSVALKHCLFFFAMFTLIKTSAGFSSIPDTLFCKQMTFQFQSRHIIAVTLNAQSCLASGTTNTRN
jgi:hypothetical protein